MSRDVDIVIVGGGLVGLSLARALAGSGLTLALVEPQPLAPLPADESWDSRIYAVSPGNASFLNRCGAWDRLPAERVARIEAMKIYGDDAAACLEFSAYDAGLPELAFIVENRRLQHALWKGAREEGLEPHCPATWNALELGRDRAVLRLADGAELAARLIVGADGSESQIRAQAGITAASGDYRRLGIVANFQCAKPHRATAFQWFLRDGVLALLPLPGSRVSMVWSAAQERARSLLELAPAAFAAEVEAASHGKLGALRLLAPAAAYPLRLQRVPQLVKPRLALVGDAAHNVHPLAGQGVNLGFRDARVLAEVLLGRGPQRDCGDLALLRRYERARKEDVGSLQLATDGLQKLFNNDAVFLAGARNLGLELVNRQPLVKNLLVRHAVA
jgi:ubiquinone biosynthesis UbiH/UbiF/VisC/COQ6 family hydroxylase